MTSFTVVCEECGAVFNKRSSLQADRIIRDHPPKCGNHTCDTIKKPVYDLLGVQMQWAWHCHDCGVTERTEKVNIVPKPRF